MISKTDSRNPVGVAKALTDENEVTDFSAYGEITYKTPISDKGNLLIKSFYDYYEFERLYEIFFGRDSRNGEAYRLSSR